MASPEKDRDKAKQSLGKCPICAKPATEKLRPFCSRRCADVDLSRWFKGIYRIPAVEPPDEWDMEESLGFGEDDPAPTSH